MTEIAVFPYGTPPDPIPEPGDVDTLEGLLRGLHRTFGRVAARLPDPHREHLLMTQQVYPVTIDPVPIPIVAGAGILDPMQAFGPTLGEHWDVHCIAVTGFTAGTVIAVINQPAGTSGGAVRYQQVAPAGAPYQFYGKAQLWLRGNSDRLVFIASGITGQPLVSMSATRIGDLYSGRYLL
jgi:hypothetical protein